MTKRQVFAIVLAAAFGCGDGGGAGPAESISIAASPPVTTLPQGGTVTITLTLGRAGGFAAPVTISVTGLPPGVTATVVPAQLTLTDAQAQVTVTAAGDVQPGTYTASVSATAPGVESASASYSLVVILSTFSLSVSPSSFQSYPGATHTATLSVSRTNWPHDVTLEVASMSDVTSTIFPPVISGNATATLAMNVLENGTTGGRLVVARATSNSRVSLASITINKWYAKVFYLYAPSQVTIRAGASGPVAITVDRQNFSGPVNLAVTGSAPGMSFAFSEQPETGNTSTLTITVGAGVTLGNYSLAISGSTPGADNFSTPLTVVITP